MPIHVIQNGIDSPPDEAWKCPYCGKRADGYKSFIRQYRRDCMLMQCELHGQNSYAVPTFSCERCGCIWQYEKETEKTEKQAVNQEGDELDALMKGIRSGDGIKPDDSVFEVIEDKLPWYKRLWNEFTFGSSRW